MAVEPERVVLDTNVLLSAVLFGGKPAVLVDAVRVGTLKGVTSLFVLQEFRQVLASPRFKIDGSLAEDLAVELARFMEVVPIGRPRGMWTADPADDLVIETALAGCASSIVTGDRRLLEAQVGGVEMITVAEMITRLQDD